MIDRILADPETLALAVAGEVDAVANRLNSTAPRRRKSIEESRLTWTGLQAALGHDAVLAIRTKLSISRQTLLAEAAAATDPNVARQKIGAAESIGLLFDTMSAGVAFADDRTQAQIAAMLAAGLIDAQAAAALSGLGFHPTQTFNGRQVETQWREYVTAQHRERVDAAIAAALTDPHLRESWVVALRAAADAMEA
jgi:hypothetical protein